MNERASEQVSTAAPLAGSTSVSEEIAVSERAGSGAGTGRVVLAGAPLGNPADASQRLRDALAGATIIAAEDTRRLRRLCADLGVQARGRVISREVAGKPDCPLD